MIPSEQIVAVSNSTGKQYEYHDTNLDGVKGIVVVSILKLLPKIFLGSMADKIARKRNDLFCLFAGALRDAVSDTRLPLCVREGPKKSRCSSIRPYSIGKSL